MRKALTILLGLSVLTGLAAAQFSKIQPKQDGISELDAEKLGSNLPGDYVNISGDTMTGNLDMNSYSILGFFNGCSSGDGMTGIYDNGTLKCSQIQSSADNLSTVLNNGNKAGENKINMTSNNITNIEWLNPNSSWKTSGSLEQIIRTNPKIVSSKTDNTYLDNARGLVKDGDYVYVGSSGNDSVSVYNVGKTGSPERIGTVVDSNSLDLPNRVEVLGNYLYVTDYTNDVLTVINISNPSNPEIAGKTSLNGYENPRGIEVVGDKVYIASSINNSILTVDVGAPSNPSFNSAKKDSTDLEGVWDIMIRGDTGYVSGNGPFGDGLFATIDVSDPTNPTIIDSITNSNLDGGRELDISENIAYVAVSDNTGNEGVATVDISDPSSLSVIGKIEEDSDRFEFANRLEEAGGFVYVGTDTPFVGNGNTLTIVDARDPNNPKIAGNVTSQSKLDRIQGLELDGGKLYTSTLDSNSLNKINVASTNAPAASIGNVETDDLDVTSDAKVGGNLKVQSGLNVGPRGIKTDGKLVADTIEATGTKNFVQSVNSTHSVVYTSSESGRATVEYSEETFATPQGSFHEFPEHFSKLLASTDYQVLTTPVNSVEKVIVSEKKLDGVELKSRNPTRVDIHVRGPRKGYEEKEVWRKR